MGRALLIISLGSYIILGIIQQAVNNRQLTMTEGNVETFMVSHGQNATNSALELAINRIIHDENWGDPQEIWEYEISGFTAQVHIDDHDIDPGEIQPNELRVRSRVQLENRTLESLAFLDRSSVNLPEIEGALSVYGENSRIRLDGVGAQLKIDGHDTHPWDDITADKQDDLPGISSVTSEEELFSQISGAASNRIFYEGDPDFNHNPDLDGTSSQQLYDEYLSIGTIYTDGGNLGTDSNPVINIIDSNTDLSGSSFGAGILVVKPGTELKITGNFTYHGLILVAGKLEIAGRPQIYGGTILMDTGIFEESLIEDPDEDHFTMSGTPGIHYSSWVLNNLTQNLRGGTGSHWALNRISY